MQREEKQLEASIDALIYKTKDLKTSITSFLIKLENEYETLQWPSVLDNFALISSHMSSLSRLLKSDKCPALRNYAVLPLQFSTEKDNTLETMTEGRLAAVTHEVVPDYLRTKPQPEVEEKVTQIINKVNSIGTETMQKQINSYTKILNTNVEAVSNARDNWDSTMSEKTTQQLSWSRSDTHELVAAVTHGTALKISHSRRPDAMSQRHPGSSQNIHMGNKATNSMRANIRGAAHPYSRP